METLTSECRASLRAIGLSDPGTISELAKSVEEWTAGIEAFAVVSKQPNPLQKYWDELSRLSILLSNPICWTTSEARPTIVFSSGVV